MARKTMKQKTKERATRDLFGCSLDLDLVIFKLENMKDDFQCEKMLKEFLLIQDLIDSVQQVRSQIEGRRIIWEHEK